MVESKYKGAAGGFKAVRISAAHVQRQLGLWGGTKLLLKVNQKDGFDCPGCAWPDPDHRSSFEFCENGAKAVAHEATTRRVDPAFFARHSIAELLAKDDFWLEQQGRLTHPMYRAPGATHYAPVAWDDAFALLGEALRGLDSPDEAAFYVSGRTSNEAAFSLQLFARMFGTNNLPDCSNMCHESSGKGLSEVIGVGKGTVGLHDFEATDAIFVIGQNPATNHPRMLTMLQAAARRGCRIVSVNPLREPGMAKFAHPQEVSGILGSGTPLVDTWVRVRIGGDIAFLKGLQKEVLARGAQDEAFIAEHTEGFDAFRQALDAVTWDEITEQSGVSRQQIAEVGQLYAQAPSAIICWAMGLTQHKFGVGNIQEVVNLLLLRGNMGRPGAGACPVRGHSNVQGDRTMGITAHPKSAFLDRLAEVADFEPPREHGLDAVHTIEAMHDGRVKVFFSMGGNFQAAAPDTAFTDVALGRTQLTVQVSTKLNRSHLVTGASALILPCLGRTERDEQRSGAQFVTVENSMGIVHMSRSGRDPASAELRSEPAIVARLAAATLGEGGLWDGLEDDYDKIRDLIAQVVPGCKDYKTRVRVPGGFLLPNGARDRDFKTKVGKARFVAHPVPRIALEDGQHVMMTIRSHDQYNTTIYGLDDRYRGVYGDRWVVFVNAEDMAEQGLSEGQEVTLRSHFKGQTRDVAGFKVTAHDIPRRCVATYFPEANPLVPVGSVAEGSNTPTSKSVVVSMHP
jgi:molybdopterin-dependent oxidoreductase alpha subunit